MAKKQTYKEALKAAEGKGTPKKFTNRQGYTVIQSPDGKMVYEHRAEEEKRLGRKLKKGEDVHHGKGGKKDNSKKNLKVESHKKHMKETPGMHKGM